MTLNSSVNLLLAIFLMSLSIGLVRWGAGRGIVYRFTKLCKGLAVVLVVAHIVVQLFPPAVTYLALIPARYIE